LTERRYTEEEIAEILRLTADHDTREGTRLEGGLTLPELQAIGHEAGLDPQVVRRAAAISVAPPGGLARVFLGAASRPSARARASGWLGPSQRAELAALCERVFARGGTTEEREGSWRWTEEHGPGRTTVDLRRQDGTTEVHVEADRHGWALLTTLASVAVAVVALEPLGGVVGIAASLGLWAGVLAPLAVAAVLLRLVYPRLTRRLAGQVERVTLAALALADDAGRAPPAEPLPRPPEGSLGPGGAGAP
jgi:hypothetical protein